MSISLNKILPCRGCGAEIEANTFESINPTRHPFLQDQLLERTLLRRSCDRCGACHQHYDRLIWTDLPGRLCACIVQEADRPHWALLEEEARAGVGSIPGLLADPPPKASLHPGFGPYSLDFTLRATVQGVDYSADAEDLLRRRILKRFRAEGVAMPLPMSTVRVERPESGGPA